jgi:excisionase family DNA binding protein
MALLNISKIYNLLKEIKSLIVVSKAEFIGIDEAAKYLRLKKSYLYNLVHRKQIPFYKPNGKKIYFNKLELSNLIASSRVKTVQEVEQELSTKRED